MCNGFYENGLNCSVTLITLTCLSSVLRGVLFLLKLFGLVLLLTVLVFNISPMVSAGIFGETTLILKVDKSKFNPRAIEALNGKVVYVAELASIVIVTVPGYAKGLLEELPGVLHVSEDIVVEVSGPPPGRGKPDKNKDSEQPPQTLPWGIDYIDAELSWDITLGFADINGDEDSEVEVAIIDTGVDKDHPDLIGNVKWGIAVFRGKISSRYNDKNGHGTHVAGIIAAINNDIGVVGVAPAVELYIIKAFDPTGSAYISDIIIAIDLAVKGPDGVVDSDEDGVVVGDVDDDAPEVISMSFGGGSNIPELHDMLKVAYDLNITLVASAGNEYSSTPSYPAAYSEVIAVGAVDEEGNVPDWSNKYPELTAPGVNVLSTYPDDSYETLDGTSMACPHVSGTVALLQAARLASGETPLPPGEENDIDNSSIRGILHMTAMGTGEYNPLYGYGVVNAYNALLALES